MDMLGNMVSRKVTGILNKGYRIGLLHIVKKWNRDTAKFDNSKQIETAIILFLNIL